MQMPSGSNIQRAIVCPGSATLPQLKGTNAAAEKGNIIHEYLASLYTGEDVVDALTSLAGKYGPEAGKELKDFHDGLDPETLPKLEEAIAELAFAYDPETDTCIELGRMVERDYSTCPKGYFPATLDLVGWDPEDRTLVILDWKTGHGDVTPPRWNWQLRLAALAMADKFEPERIRVVLGKSADGWKFPSYDVDMHKDLEFWRRDLMRLKTQVLTAVDRNECAPIKTGPHCKYCPAYAACPAQTSLIRKLVESPIQSAQDINNLLTTETVGLAAQRYLQVKELMRMLEQAFRSWVDSEGEIDLGNNQVLGKVMTDREELDGEKVFGILEKLYDTETAKKACEFSTSKAAIKRALATKVAKGKGAAAEREVMEQVREQKAVVVKPREEFRVHHRGEE